MKAMVYTRYGSPDVLELKEVPKPVPKAGEVLVRVHATALNAADWRLLTGTPRLLRLMLGLFRPKHPVLGADVAQKVDLARSLGADHVVDYAKEDFTKSGGSYDLILDVAAYRPFSEYRPALTPEGVYVLVGGHFSRILQVMLRGPWASRRGGQRFRALMAKPDPAGFAFVSGLLEAGKVVPVIERRYPLLEAAEALRYLGQGHARGKLVVTVRQEPVPSSPSA
ncbi:MAG: hypothetical protein C4333_01400 [Meiothermus sp.]